MSEPEKGWKAWVVPSRESLLVGSCNGCGEVTYIQMKTPGGLSIRFCRECWRKVRSGVSR